MNNKKDRIYNGEPETEYIGKRKLGIKVLESGMINGNGYCIAENELTGKITMAIDMGGSNEEYLAELNQNDKYKSKI